MTGEALNKLHEAVNPNKNSAAKVSQRSVGVVCLSRTPYLDMFDMRQSSLVKAAGYSPSFSAFS